MIEVDHLQKEIEGRHRCSARLVQSVPVKETHKGAAVWEGVVHVFDLEGHPTASRVYARSSPIEGSPDQRQILCSAASAAGHIASGCGASGDRCGAKHPGRGMNEAQHRPTAGAAIARRSGAL